MGSMDPSENLYWYKVQVADDGDVSSRTRPVVDGDSVYLWLDLGLRSWTMALCRLAGIDTPERGEIGFEEAKDMLSHELATSDDLMVRSEELGKYGRPIVTIYQLRDEGWVNLNQHMIDIWPEELYGSIRYGDGA